MTGQQNDRAEFWSGRDDDDLVPIPGQPLRLGDVRGNNKLEVQAQVWLFLELQAKQAMREAYQAMVVAETTDEERIGIMTRAAVRLGMSVLQKFQEVEEQRREIAPHARAAAIEAEHETRWGPAVRALLSEDDKRSAHRLAVLLRTNKDVKHPPAQSEQSTFGRYVRKAKDKMKVRHSLSE